MWRNLLTALFAVITLAAVFIYLRDPYSDAPSTTQAPDSVADNQTISDSTALRESNDSELVSGESAADNPFSIVENESVTTTTQTDIISQYSADAASDEVAESTLTDNSNDTRPDKITGALAGIPISELGVDRWQSDEQFDALVAELDANPALLNAVLEQYQITSDPDQLARLTQLLSRFDSSEVTAVAADIARSGSTENRLAAINLLRTVQGSNPDARDTLLGIIEDEADSRVLTRALGAFDSQASATSAQRQQLLNRATELASHQDGLVRSRSYTALAGWTDSSQLTPQILQGLSDPDNRVRRDLTYSLINYQFVDGQVKQELIRVASDGSEIQRTRRGALQALARISLTDDERALLRDVSAQVNSTQTNSQ